LLIDINGKTIGARTGTPKFAQLTDRDPARRNRPAPERPKHNLGVFIDAVGIHLSREGWVIL
jgi:hypothetical protein